MGFSERYTLKGLKKTPEEVEGTVYDNGSASGGTFLQTKYRPRCAF